MTDGLYRTGKCADCGGDVMYDATHWNGRKYCANRCRKTKRKAPTVVPGTEAFERRN